MNRKERRAAQKRGGPTMSPMAATLADGFRAHQAGHRSDAERLYRDVLSVEPRNAGALHLLGALMHQTGRNDEAISLIKQAVAIEPNNPDFRYNLGCILLAAEKVEEAIPQLEKAIAQNPTYAAAHSELGNAFARAGRLADAEKSLHRALELQPGDAALYNNLGRLAMAQGRTDDAMTMWRRALQHQPDLALAHYNLGLAEIAAGRAAEAEASLRRAIAAQPGYTEAKQQLAALLLSRGNGDEALALATEALARQETNETKQTFARALLSATFKPDAALRERLRRAIAEAWLDPRELAPACAAVIKAHPVIAPAIHRVNEQWSQAIAAQQHVSISDTEIASLEDAIIVAYLQASPNCDLDLERFLISARANILDRALQDGNVSDRLVNVSAALARQCFLNEYVFPESVSETTRVAELTAKLQGTARDGKAPSPIQLAALAMYRPLYRLEGADRLLQLNWPEVIAALLQQQIAEPRLETELRSSVRKLTDIDQTSDAVREHYEANPYPRWVQAASTFTPNAIIDVLRASIPPEDCPALPPLAAPEVLIAGCGTGLQAVTSAQAYSNSKILAIDLSAASLAYAQRQANKFGLSNIEFAQADLLKLGEIGRQFDLIEAGGVLHHLAEPFAGWKKLLPMLRPGGLMKVALYSEIARRDVAAAREFAAAGNYQPDLEGIRLCRQAILRLPEEAAARSVLRSADFYSTSGFRDLVLHGREHRMSLPQIAEFLAENGLEFIGLETSNDVRDAFARRFPDPAARQDLAAWHQFEIENPETFLTIYVLWLQKVVA